MTIGICNTTRGDVKNCVQAIKEQKLSVTRIIQIPSTAYRNWGMEEWRQFQNEHTNPEYVINLKTSRLHKVGCRYARGDTIPADIIKPKSTGLYLCRVCIAK